MAILSLNRYRLRGVLLAPLLLVWIIAGCSRHEQYQSGGNFLQTQEDDCNLGAGESCNQVVVEQDLFAKVAEGDIDSLKLGLKNGFQINQTREESGKTLLMFAIEAKHISIVEYLVEYDGIDLSVQDSEGRDALWYAEQTFDDKIISLITGETLTVEELNNSLMSSIHSNNLSAVESLLDDGAEIEARVLQDGKVVTPLLYAIQLGFLDIVELLLKKNASSDSTFWTTDLVDTGLNGLMTAIDRANLDIFNLILPRMINIEAKDADGKTAMFYVAHIKNDINIAKAVADALVARGASLVPARNDGMHFLTYVYEEQSNIPLGDYLYDICLDRHSQAECDEL